MDTGVQLFTAANLKRIRWFVWFGTKKHRISGENSSSSKKNLHFLKTLAQSIFKIHVKNTFKNTPRCKKR